LNAPAFTVNLAPLRRCRENIVIVFTLQAGTAKHAGPATSQTLAGAAIVYIFCEALPGPGFLLLDQ